MSVSTKSTRRRVGRVSVYEHHGSWYTLHTEAGKPVRRRVEGGEARAEYDASLLNARLVAAEANLCVETTALAGGEVVDASGVATASVAVADLRRAFLDHHEHVLGSAVATVSRYRAATRYLEDLAQVNDWDAAGVDVARLVQHLRAIEVAPMAAKS
jgi:hypothetical protein